MNSKGDDRDTSAMRLLPVGWLALVLCAFSACTDPTPDPRRHLASREEIRIADGLRYFQRRLIEHGADSQSVVWGDLAMLGLNGRELQGLPITDAYQRAHNTARRVADTAMRRRILLELFDETEE